MTPKPYQVSRIAGAPNFDSLPVAKITDYPLEERDYKPFAQSILCLGADRLHLRMWAFEVSPPPGSALCCAIYPYPETPERALLFWMEHGEERPNAAVHLLKDGEPGPEETALPLDCHPLGGEDLQGVYWGLSLSLPLGALAQFGAPGLAAPFPGNFYKLCRSGPFAHWGSLFPARFPDHPFGPESMGTFRPVSY